MEWEEDIPLSERAGDGGPAGRLWRPEGFEKGLHVRAPSNER